MIKLYKLIINAYKPIQIKACYYSIKQFNFTLKELKQSKEALKQFDLALLINPKCPQIYKNKGVVLIQIKIDSLLQKKQRNQKKLPYVTKWQSNMVIPNLKKQKNGLDKQKLKKDCHGFLEIEYSQ